ncbi:MAG TPA: ATP-binding protein [Candidatus Binatia bacterium]
MYLTAEQVRKLDGPTLELFLRRKYPEGHHLDYKAQLSHPDQKAHREFLKDISAFANANGGHLLIGVKEPSDDLDLGAQVVGIDRPLDVAQKLENLASSSIDPRIAGLQIIPVTVCGKGIIFIHVPPSSTRPHRVDHQGHSAFYRRHTESIFAMTTHTRSVNRFFPHWVLSTARERFVLSTLRC